MIDFKSILLYGLIAYLVVWAYKIIYSIFFSPLKNIPGPFIVHFFPNYIRSSTIINGTSELVNLELHKKYGNAVRIGGNMVTFATEDAVKEIYMSYNYQKSDYYKALRATGETTFSTQDRKFHSDRKKIIAPSFSEKSILSVEYLVKKNVDNLVSKINELATEGISFDIGKYFHFFTFDVIGDVAFGKSFEMMNNGYHPILGWIKDRFFFQSLAYALPFMKYYKPAFIKKLYDFSYDAINKSKSHPDRVTILNALLNASDSETGEKLSDKDVAEESILQLIAGTDTTSNSLAWLFYLLTKYPDIYDKVKMELNMTFPDKDTITYTKCKTECPYLSAVIYESLRIIPVAGLTPRLVPKGGKVIDGYFIPGGTEVGVHVMTHHNYPGNWNKPDEFKIERWLYENGKFKTNNNFMPFLIGPRACLGRTLAWMELYLATASLIRNFNFSSKNPDEKVEQKYFIITAPKTSIEVIASK